MAEPLPSIVEYSVNLKDQEEPDPLPVGEYEATIGAVEQKESQRGTRYAAVSFMISSEQYPIDFKDGNPDGTMIVYRRVGLEDTPISRFGTKRFCTAIGAPLAKKIDITEWLGSTAIVEVIHDTFEDITRAVINKVRAAD